MKAESMVTDTAERKAARSNQAASAPPPEPEHLPCPRCDSTNTKFCYYNNYNLSQPRHFCKSCRRYWTHGGTLRDIPIGGCSRKNAKRSRTVAAAFSSPHRHEYRNFQAAASQILVPFAADYGGAGGPFTSLLSTQGTAFWALGGFGGIGLGHGPNDVGFGLGKTVWPFQEVVEGGPTSGGYTWQVENGREGGLNGGDCFAYSDLDISTPGGSFIMK